MSDDYDERPVGPLLDALDITVGLLPTQRITEAVVIAKCVDLEDGQVSLVLTHSDLDWIALRGLMETARDVERQTVARTDDD